MSKQIGFIILSHNYPQQLRRLVLCLQRIYDNPPIAIHHDISQSPLQPDEFPSDVKFVSPHLKTRWGQFSVVMAALRALKLLYQKTPPDWFVLLSGADYPTMSADRVVKDLKSSGMDALLDYHEIRPRQSGVPYSIPENSALSHFASSANRELAWRRYIGLNLWVPVVRSGPRIGRWTAYLPFEDWRSPFDQQFKCYYGDHWFAGNRKVADILLNPIDKHLELRRYLRLRTSPDECYYQTSLVNTPGLKISTTTRRFSDWSGGGSHSQVLDLNHLPAIISSRAHFARKFALNSAVLDELDKMLS